MTTAAKKKPLTAWDLVSILASLTRMNVEFMAKAGNVPPQNLHSWLAGKQQNLRMQSISTIMSLLGLVIKEKGISLATNRVHFWFVDEKLFAPKKAYAHLSSVSRLLANTAITKVAVPGDKQDYVLLGGNYGVRVVVVINKTILNKNKNFVTPDLVKGAFWLNDDDEHCIDVADHALVGFLSKHDLTIHEFDRIFSQRKDSCSWNDVALQAREFGVQAEDVAAWINQRASETHSHTYDVTTTDGQDQSQGVVDIENQRLFYLSDFHNRKTG